MLDIRPCVTGPFQVNGYVLIDKNTHTFGIIDAPGHLSLAENLLTAGYRAAWIALTHGHIDHIAGLKKLKTRLRCPVYMHPDDQYLLAHVTDNPFRELLDADLPPDPDVWFGPDTTLALGATRLSIHHTPGHTPGGVCLYDSTTHLFTGDTLFYESVGRTDLPGGDHAMLIDSIRRELMALPDTVQVHPGHGPDTTVGHEREHNPYIQ